MEQFSQEFQTKIMRLCLSLAAKGQSNVKKNPMVGAVLVSKAGEILSEGYHQAFGEEHAEAIALKKWNIVPSGAVLFVNLEPCCHQGKNPPCVENIIKKKVSAVIIGMEDPHLKVAGKGIQKLSENCIKTKIFLKNECQWFNQKYIVNTLYKRPLVAVKVATSLDGKIALTNGCSQWITGAEARKKGQSLRSQFDAVGIGKNTLLQDNPRLTNRVLGQTKQPQRVVFWGEGKLNPTCHFLTDLKSRRFLIVNKAVTSNYIKELEKSGVVVSSKNSYSIKEALDFLYNYEIYSLLIEGGAKLIESFIKEQLLDRLYLFLAPSVAGNESKSWVGNLGLTQLDQQPKFRFRDIENVGDDLFLSADILSYSKNS